MLTTESKFKTKIHKFLPCFVVTLIFFVTVGFTACAQSNTKPVVETSYNTETEVKGLQHYNGYTLKQSTVLSRHNIRSPLTESGSVLNKLTPHEWFDWTANSSELSLRGGELETVMGQYFRKYLISEKLIPDNWIPEDDQTYFYANSYQRTIATAQYFSTGMLPIANVDIYHKNALNVKDEIFLPVMNKMDDNIKNKIMKEIEDLGDGKGLNGITESLSEEFKTLEDFLDFKDSEYAKEKNITSFPLDDLKVNIVKDDEITCTGSLSIGNSAADAFKLQLYEQPDDFKATFGKNISYSQMKQIAKIADVYEYMLFGTHTASIIASHPMLQEIQKDLDNQKRKFTFLCGHDSTILSVLAALGVKEYDLPNAISKITPIGVKLVINRYVEDKTGEEFCTLSLVYETVDQLRHRDELSLSNPPMEYQLELDGLQKNSSGMYKYSDVHKRLTERIAEYDKL